MNGNIHVKNSSNSCVTSTWIANKMVSLFRFDLNLSYDTIHVHVLRTYGVQVTKTPMCRAKKKGKEQIERNHAKTYNKLKQYAKMVMAANPRYVAKLQVKRATLTANLAFKQFFLCLGVMKNGVIKGCRPFRGLDGWWGDVVSYVI